MTSAAPTKKLTKAGAVKLLAAASAAAEKAAAECKPTPMLVGSPTTPLGSDIDPRKTVYLVAGGPCGMAGVVVTPARGPIVTVAKAKEIGYANYGGGYYLPSWKLAPSTRYEQSMQIAEAAAYAACRVLSDAGVSCYVSSRMD